MTEGNGNQLCILYLSWSSSLPTRLVHSRPRKQVLHLNLRSGTVRFSGFKSGKGLMTTSWFLSFPFVKPATGAQLHSKLLGKSSGSRREGKQDLAVYLRCQWYYFDCNLCSVFIYSIKEIQLLVFQAISLHCFRNMAVEVNVVLSCPDP